MILEALLKRGGRSANDASFRRSDPPAFHRRAVLTGRANLAFLFQSKALLQRGKAVFQHALITPAFSSFAFFPLRAVPTLGLQFSSPEAFLNGCLSSHTLSTHALLGGTLFIRCTFRADLAREAFIQ